MTISIDWPSGVISVPRDDMTLVQTSPVEIRELNLNIFRLILKDLEDDFLGITFTKTHKHNTEVTLGGLIYARVIEILEPYTITFEDGQYAVNLVGANSNVGDRVNVNNVSVRSANSAGLISTSAVEYASFNGGVTIDAVNGYNGTAYPIGTPNKPVKSVESALLIAEYRGLIKLFIVGDITFTTGDDISEYIIEGQSVNKTNINIETGAMCNNCEFENARVVGVLDGGSQLKNCITGDLEYVNGEMMSCGLFGTIELSGNAQASFMDCNAINVLDLPVIDLGGAGQNCIFNDWSGNISFRNLTSSANKISIQIDGGSITLDSSITSGDVTISGVGVLIKEENYSYQLNIDGLLNKELIASTGWEDVHIDTVIGTSGTQFPLGTFSSPVNNLTDAIVIANRIGSTSIDITGDLTLDHDVSNFHFSGKGSNTVNLNNQNVEACYFELLIITGDQNATNATNFNKCKILNVNKLGGMLTKCIFANTAPIIINDSLLTIFNDCRTGSESVTFDFSNDNININVQAFSGGFKVINSVSADNSLIIDFIAGKFIFDNSNTHGDFDIRGIADLSEYDKTATANVNTDGIINAEYLVDSIWDEDKTEHNNANSTGNALSNTESTVSDIDNNVNNINGKVDNLPENVADQIWDEQLSEHQTDGSTGKGLGTASSGGVDYGLLADAIWNDNIVNRVTPNSAGLSMFLLLSELTNNAQIVDNDDGTKTVTIWTAQGAPNIHKQYTISTLGLIETKVAV